MSEKCKMSHWSCFFIAWTLSLSSIHPLLSLSLSLPSIMQYLSLLTYSILNISILSCPHLSFPASLISYFHHSSHLFPTFSHLSSPVFVISPFHHHLSSHLLNISLTLFLSSSLFLLLPTSFHLLSSLSLLHLLSFLLLSCLPRSTKNINNWPVKLITHYATFSAFIISIFVFSFIPFMRSLLSHDGNNL